MRKLKILIKGETINLCIPTVEFARKFQWYNWLNDPNIARYLLPKYKNFKNTQKKQDSHWIVQLLF